MSTSERPHQGRERSKSTFSFKSHKSHGSRKSGYDQHGEPPVPGQSHHQRTSSKDHEHKQHFTPATKADPNAAMNEVQPVAAALEKPTLQSLRSFDHKDFNGNPIAEPDLSNPTRNRWERPLDTIRSFEAAIDSEYKRRSMVLRGDMSDAGGFASRRTSYYSSAYDQGRPAPGYGNGGYYGSRQAAAARESWAGDNAYSNGNGYGPGYGPHRNSRYGSRAQYDNGGYNRQSNGHGVYPTPGYQQSRDTVNTHNSNGSHSEPYSADPSSESSSLERGGPVRQPDLGEQYGFTGFGGNPQPILEEYPGSADGGYFSPQQQQQYGNGNANGGPPPVPRKPAPVNNPNVIKLSGAQDGGAPAVGGGSGGRPNMLARKSTEAGDKRKSWFKRRFSKDK